MVGGSGGYRPCASDPSWWFKLIVFPRVAMCVNEYSLFAKRLVVARALSLHPPPLGALLVVVTGGRRPGRVAVRGASCSPI